MTVVGPVEVRLAGLTFRPWWDDETPPERTGWTITIEFLDRKPPMGHWLERQYRATIRDAAYQVIAQVTSSKPEGGLVRVAVEALCHQLGPWWATPDTGAYSVDWLCGYLAGQRSVEDTA